MRVLTEGRDAAIALIVALGISAASIAAAQNADSEDPPDQTYATGAIEPTPETIRSLTQAPTFRSFLPEQVDLSDRLPAPGNQKNQGSCVGWAVGYAARSYYVAAKEGRSLTEHDNVPSPAYIYNLAVAADGRSGCDGGMTLPAALDTLRSGGVSLADMPYSETTCRPPTAAVKSRATRFRISDYLYIAPGALDTVKGELAQGNPVVFGMRLAPSFQRHRGAGTYRRSVSELLDPGAHAMVIVGYDERRQAFRLQNSWGTGWGARGRAWLAYDTFARDSHSAFVMRPIHAVAPAPQPAPAPVVEPRPNPPQPAPQPKPPEPPKPAPVVEPRPAPAPTPEPPPPPAPKIVLPDNLECASVVVSERGGATDVRGFVKSEADLERVRSAAGTTAKLDVAVRPWPQCEILLTLGERTRSPDGPTVAVPNAQALASGDTLVIEVTAPDQPVHLHVAYIQADGSVAHLVQADASNLRTYARRQKIVFGDGREGRARFKVSAPYGSEMAVVLASRAPIFSEPRPKSESERDFLTALRRALLWKPDTNAPERIVSAATIPIVTKDK